MYFLKNKAPIGAFLLLFGGCSSKQSQYYDANYEQVKSDAAKGSGEHLDTYLKISGCGKNGASRVKQNFNYIFSQNKDDSFKKMNQVIEESKSSDN